MISVSDILKILDQVPLWKALKEMPKRIDALEKRIAELEGTPKASEHLHTCAQCGAPAKVTSIRPHPMFDFAGRKVRTITCEQGHSLEFDWDPGKD